MRTRAHLAAASLLAIQLFPAAARAQISPFFTYAGYLEDSGVPLSGTVSAFFEVFDGPDAASATMLWSESFAALSVTDGYFAVELDAGSGSELRSALVSGGSLWLRLTVNGTVLAPLMRINSVPYSVHSLVSDEAATLAGFDPGAYSTTSQVQSLLSTEGASSVHWGNLTQVPAELADGDDVLSEAEVEGYVANGIAQGAIPYSSGSALVASSLTYSAANSRLGLGTPSPSRSLHVMGGAVFTDDVTLSGKRITDVGPPVGEADVATKGYVDAAQAERTMYLSSLLRGGNHNCDDDPSTCCVAGYHMCDPLEIYGRRVETSGTNRYSTPGSAAGWIKTNASTGSSDCAGWSSVDSAHDGARFSFSASGNGFVVATYQCNMSLRVWCCSD